MYLRITIIEKITMPIKVNTRGKLSLHLKKIVKEINKKCIEQVPRIDNSCSFKTNEL